MTMDIAGQVAVPGAGAHIYKDECIFCFDSAVSPSGIFVCLKRFFGICQRHLPYYVRVTKQKIFLNVRVKKTSTKTDAASNLTAKPTKLAIGVEGGFAADAEEFQFSHDYDVYFADDDRHVVLAEAKATHAELAKCVDAIIDRPDAFRLIQLESAASTWEGEERKISRYADQLEQFPSQNEISTDGKYACTHPGCDKTDNLWLNLSDGTIFCGRRYFDGSGGNNHAIEHYQATGFPLCVKLGTITGEGADVFSYAPDEDSMVIDPKLDEHLKFFGVDMRKMAKTDKTMNELEIDLNLRRWEYDAIQESSEQLDPVFGSGFTGMENLGNTCYMNSVMQVLASIDKVRDLFPATDDMNANRYYSDNCPPDAPANLLLQLSKLMVGLNSGRYSFDATTSESTGVASGTRSGAGVRPIMFRQLIGATHPEFSTSRQQDAAEFFQYLLSRVAQNQHVAAIEKLFTFQLEERLQCTETQQVRYLYRPENVFNLPIPQNVEAGSVISFSRLVNDYLEDDYIEDFVNPAAGGDRTIILKHTRLATLPRFLLVQIYRFAVDPTLQQVKKVDVKVDMPDVIDLKNLKGKGLQPDEVEMSAGGGASQSAIPGLDHPVVMQLLAMGFTDNACRRAVMQTTGGAEAAMEYLLAHMDNPELNSPIEEPPRSDTAAGQPKDAVDDMGDSTKYQLVAFISHMGSSVHVGHYVCHIRRRLADGSDKWVVYNDEKVAVSKSPPRQLAYLYLYRNVDA